MSNGKCEDKTNCRPCEVVDCKHAGTDRSGRMKKYRTGGCNNKIESVEILRETDKQVVIAGEWRERREEKRGDYRNYFDTWEEAKEFLVNEAEKKVESLNNQLDFAKLHLAKMKELKQTDDSEVAK